ncbi:TetR/AcrR family transcriptional regulator [Ilyomonas limi]|uniref:TetR/AcrR family transcriptional regulator n=1 Tax=Ilyomonas limi TaxID=2575867 RepID=A0A4U3L1B3_9BACT|nr:TetR/AcrR family transcriptional regulator [Ilyomonas limi]
MEMKERILTKAEELFCRYGIKSVTMDEIANQLGISKKTIYLSFADKDELVLEVFTAYMNESKQHCLHDRQEAENAVHEIFLAMDMTDAMLKALNASILFDLEKYYPDTYKKFKAYKYEFLYNVVSENLKRGIQEELFRADLNVDIITRMRLGTVMLSMNIEMFPPGKYKLVEVEQEIIMHYLYGIATAKGIKLIQKYNSQRQKSKP